MTWINHFEKEEKQYAHPCYKDSTRGKLPKDSTKSIIVRIYRPKKEKEIDQTTKIIEAKTHKAFKRDVFTKMIQNRMQQ